MAALAAERREREGVKSPMLPGAKRRAVQEALIDPQTGTVSYNLTPEERAAVYAERVAEAADLGKHPAYGFNLTEGQLAARRAEAAAAQRVRLVADRSVAPPRPSSSLVARAAKCVGDTCKRVFGRKTEGGRRRRHHKGKKTLKRTRRHRRSSRR